MDFVEICNVCTRKVIIKAAKRIFNSEIFVAVIMISILASLFWNTLYILGAVPPVYVVSNHVYRPISLPLQIAERLRRAQPVSIANHVKARRSLIKRSVT